MATRALIGILNPDSSITSIYCHHDGHPPALGRTLKEHYTTTALAEDLVSRGDASSIEETTEDSRFYITDLGQSAGSLPERSSTRHEFFQLAKRSGALWAYLWIGQEWKQYTVSKWT